MIRRPPISTPLYSSAASDVYNSQKLVGQNDGDDSSQARLETGGTCMLRVDSEQGERDGDVIGAGIYNNKCWVPGC